MDILIQKFTNFLRSTITFFNSIFMSWCRRCKKVFYLLCARLRRSKLFKQVLLPSSSLKKQTCLGFDQKTRSFGGVGQALVGVSSSKKPAYLGRRSRHTAIIHNTKYSTANVINICNNLDASLSEFYQ